MGHDEAHGISDEDLETLNSEMLQAMNGVENIEDLPGGEDLGEEEEEGKTATFPFLNRLFSGETAKSGESGGQEEGGARGREKERKETKNGKRKYLESYCISLTQKAQDGKLDPVIGREEEIERGGPDPQPPPEEQTPCLIGEPGVGKTAIAEGLAPADRQGRRALQAPGQGGLSLGSDGPGGRHPVPRPVREPDEGPHRRGQAPWATSS